MYFPSLESLKNYQVDPLIIDKLDRWLGLQLPATYHFLNPLQFSIDMSIDTSLSIQTFALCTQVPMSIMKVRYRLFCPSCGEYDKLTSDFTFEKEYITECSHCGHRYDATDYQDFIDLFFQLLIEPEIDSLRKIPLPSEVNVLLGKSESLRLKDVKDNPSIRRLLLSHYNEQVD